jgi:lipoprotein-anchoring transpeptidase ErfK/SrfK
MRGILILLLAPALLLGTAEGHATEAAVRLEVSLSERVLIAHRGEEEVGRYRVAVGKSTHPTPTGTFRVRRIIWNPGWVPPKAPWARGKTPKAPGEPGNPMGRVKIFFQEPDYYIHGTPEEESLGSAASHGCLRLANDDVIELAKLLMEHGGEARPPGWFQRVLNRVRSTEEVRLPRGVPLTIRR